MTDVITEAIPFDEPDCIKAMELYTAVAGKDTYDASATLDAFLSIRPYRDHGGYRDLSGNSRGVHLLSPAGRDQCHTLLCRAALAET